MTGLFFGSFNPVHTGHLLVAEFMWQQAGLDEVWFMVSPQNPLKEPTQLATETQRLNMVKLAIRGNKKLVASDFEFKLPRPSYTIVTMAALQQKFPKKKFALITGSDSLESIHQWKEWSTLLEKYLWLVYRRGPIRDVEWKQYPNVVFFDTPYIRISSSHIRSLLGEKKSVRYLIPDAVGEFIASHRLYRKPKKPG